MREEIAAAVVFITRLIKGQTVMTEEQILSFSEKLSSLLLEKYKNHWYDDEPMKGQGYRCIRINENASTEPLLEEAAVCSGVKYGDLKLPLELTLWVDPKEVTCRFGEHIGSHSSIATFNSEGTENNADTINIETLIKKQNEARNKIISRLRTKTPSKSQGQGHSYQYSPSKTTNKYFNPPTYQPDHPKSRNNNYNHHKAKQSLTPSKRTPPKITPKSDRFHWVAKHTPETVEVKS